MELFGIVFSIPAAFIASVVYRVFVLKLHASWSWVKPVFLLASYVVLGVILVEWILLLLLGAVGARLLVGPMFYPIHVGVFVLGTPALLNILILSPSSKHAGRWLQASSLSTVLALVLVLQQYLVSESLYGIDQGTGPFSETDQR